MYIQKTKNIIEFLLNGGKDLKIEEELLEQVQQFSKTIETGEIEKIPKSISNIFNLSWNSSIDIEQKEQFLSLLFILYAKDLIDIKILKEDFQHFQLTNDLKHEYVIMSFLIYSIKNNKSKEIDYIQYLNFCREIGIRPRYFSEFKAILEKLELPFSISQKNQNLAEKLEKVVKFLQEKSSLH